MGLVREQIIGRTLGASREADLYFASFTLPDFLNYLLAAGALSIVFCTYGVWAIGAGYVGF
jgi:putative peptidoglycan lipid II flippase